MRRLLEWTVPPICAILTIMANGIEWVVNGQSLLISVENALIVTLLAILCGYRISKIEQLEYDLKVQKRTSRLLAGRLTKGDHNGTSHD